MKQIYFLFFVAFFSFSFGQEFKKDTVELQETILYDKRKFKLKRVGHDTHTKSIQIGLSADINFKKDSLPEFIEEMVIPIKATNKEYTFQRLNFNFSHPIHEDSIVLRVDLHASENGELNKSLFKEAMEVTVKKEYQQDNIFSMDLRDLNLKHRGDFFIRIELLSAVEKPVYFSAALLGKCLYKTPDSKEWKKIPLGVTPAINADILIQRK